MSCLPVRHCDELLPVPPRLLCLLQKNGLIDLQQLEDAMRPDTALVSVIAVNNEIGVVQPLAEIGKLCRQKKVG